jgi:hypothetical protein
MAFKMVRCPRCGNAPVGTCERLLGTALLYETDDGLLEHAGDTEVDWNSGQTDFDMGGRALFHCEVCCEDFLAPLVDEDDAIPDESLTSEVVDGPVTVEHCALAAARTLAQNLVDHEANAEPVPADEFLTFARAALRDFIAEARAKAKVEAE